MWLVQMRTNMEKAFGPMPAKPLWWPRRQPGLFKGQLRLPSPDELLAPLPPEELDAIEQGSAQF